MLRIFSCSLSFFLFLPTFNATLARWRLSLGQSHDSVLTATTRSTQGAPSWSKSKAVSKCVESTWHWDTVALVVSFVLFLWFAPSRPGIAARLVAPPRSPNSPLSPSLSVCRCPRLSSWRLFVAFQGILSFVFFQLAKSFPQSFTECFSSSLFWWPDLVLQHILGSCPNWNEHFVYQCEWRKGMRCKVQSIL